MSAHTEWGVACFVMGLIVGIVAIIFLMVSTMADLDSKCQDAGFAKSWMASSSSGCIDHSGTVHVGTFDHCNNFIEKQSTCTCSNKATICKAQTVSRCGC